MEIKINLSNTEHKDLISYCNLNDLLVSSVVKDSLPTAADGKDYSTKLYNLDAILAGTTMGRRVPRHPDHRRNRTSHKKGLMQQLFPSTEGVY